MHDTGAGSMSTNARSARHRQPVPSGHGARAQRGRDLRRRRRGLAVLADGMGGYNAGEVASGIAVNVISEGMMPELVSGRELSKVDIQTGLTHAALLLQQQIAAREQGHLRGRAEPSRVRRHGHHASSPPCSAATAFRIGHIGDSRCYRLRGDRFEQLTRDHSLLQEQIDSGQLTPEQARVFAEQEPGDARARHRGDRPGRHFEYRVEADDIYLLCSDGLTDMVDTEVVHGVVDEQRATLAVAAARADRAREPERRARQHLGDPGARARRVPADGWLAAALELAQDSLTPGRTGYFPAVASTNLSSRWRAIAPTSHGQARSLPPDGTPMDMPLNKERITIGRRADNDVCLPNPAVSGEHAAVVDDPRRFVSRGLAQHQRHARQRQGGEQALPARRRRVRRGPASIRVRRGRRAARGASARVEDAPAGHAQPGRAGGTGPSGAARSGKLGRPPVARGSPRARVKVRAFSNGPVRRVNRGDRAPDPRCPLSLRRAQPTGSSYPRSRHCACSPAHAPAKAWRL